MLPKREDVILALQVWSIVLDFEECIPEKMNGWFVERCAISVSLMSEKKVEKKIDMQWKWSRRAKFDMEGVHFLSNTL